MRTVIGFLGSTLDAGPRGRKKWDVWRPTVSACMHSDLKIDRYVLIYQSHCEDLLRRVLYDMAEVSPETVVTPVLMDFNDPWDFEEVYGKIHEFAHGFTFSPNEEYLINITTGTHVVQICLFLLTESNFLPGKLLQLGKIPRGPIAGSFSIIDLDLARYDSIAKRFEEALRDDLTFLKSGIETRNEKFNKLIRQIEQAARVSREPILLTGPTGAGKSHLAGRIFELKQNSGLVTGEFVQINCATLRSDSAMSALFGHVKGSFTGASSDRIGALKRADRGILFLDEIGELGLDEQAMLLRAVEDKLFQPLGSDCETESDFQLICGTNRNLSEAVRQGRFREDLLARIDLWTFSIPPLAERKEDIEPNIQFELERFARKYNRKVSFSSEAYQMFTAFAQSPQAKWTSNFRDLSGAVTRMAALSQSGRITVDEVKAEIQMLGNRWSGSADTPEYPYVTKYLGEEASGRLDLFDKPQLEMVLRVCSESASLSEAGRILFAGSRARKTTGNDSDRVRKYLLKFGICSDDLRTGIGGSIAEG